MGKTAVVIIHGVGEQKPMGTVRGFVRFFAGGHFRSKPDSAAVFYELRRRRGSAAGAPRRGAGVDAVAAEPAGGARRCGTGTWSRTIRNGHIARPRRTACVPFSMTRSGGARERVALGYCRQSHLSGIRR